MHLIQLNRIWTMIKVSLAALIINPLLNAPLILLGYKMGPGWAGGMSALASICTEGANAAITFYILGNAAVDKRFWVVLGKTLAICGLVTGLHYVTEPLGIWRIGLEVAAYGILAMVTGALPMADIQRMIRDAVNARKAQKNA
jgi:peptidoglycan biosynthesis protein MviN/MurJ (putative lipid II flippase)